MRLPWVGSETINLGEKITVNGAVEGGTAPYTYAYYYKRSTNTKWKVLGTEFGTETTAKLKPTSAGSFDIRVVVKDSAGKTSTKLMTATAK